MYMYIKFAEIDLNSEVCRSQMIHVSTLDETLCVYLLDLYLAERLGGGSSWSTTGCRAVENTQG